MKILLPQPPNYGGGYKYGSPYVDEKNDLFKYKTFPKDFRKSQQDLRILFLFLNHASSSNELW